MAEKNQLQSTKVKTGVVRLSYAYLFHPKEGDNGAEKYSVSIIIPKSDKVTIAKIKEAVEAAKEQGKTSKFGGKVPANLKTPLRDGDIDREDDEVYANSYFFNCSSHTKPGLIYRNGEKLENEEHLYSGCYAKVSVNFYPYNRDGSKGIAAGLNNIMKWEDGEPLGGRSSAESDFADDIDEDYEDESLL